MRIIIGLFMIFIFVFAHDTPYSLKKFQKVLDGSKLQAPVSKYNSLYARKYGDFKYFENRYFYLQDDIYMVFYMCGVKQRSELRRRNSWKVATKKPKILEAEVKLFPLNAKREFTFLQIHDDSTKEPYNNKPLLRIAWMKEHNNKKDHIWAIIKIIYMGIYRNLKLDMGKMSKEFMNVKIEVINSKLNVWVNKKNKIKDFNLLYWKNYYNYFKAGIYLQDDGCAKALFNKLSIKD